MRVADKPSKNIFMIFTNDRHILCPPVKGARCPQIILEMARHGAAFDCLPEQLPTAIWLEIDTKRMTTAFAQGVEASCSRPYGRGAIQNSHVDSRAI